MPARENEMAKQNTDMMLWTAPDPAPIRCVAPFPALLGLTADTSAPSPRAQVRRRKLALNPQVPSSNSRWPVIPNAPASVDWFLDASPNRRCSGGTRSNGRKPMWVRRAETALCVLVSLGSRHGQRRWTGWSRFQPWLNKRRKARVRKLMAWSDGQLAKHGSAAWLLAAESANDADIVMLTIRLHGSADGEELAAAAQPRLRGRRRCWFAQCGCKCMKTEQSAHL
jgi:hypothetical protein